VAHRIVETFQPQRERQRRSLHILSHPSCRPDVRPGMLNS
jgi:hypothetical protein